jgi:UDP-N-acetylmuramate dehydrogenase
MVKYDEPLCRHTSFGIGGPAFCWAGPEDFKQLLEAIYLAETKNKPFVIFGSGTNLLVSDEGFNGVVIHLGEGFDSIKRDTGDVIKAGAGLTLAALIKYAYEEGLAGCEFLTGIPGDFGGAVFMNAGVRSLEDPERFNEIKDIIVDIEVLDLADKKIKILEKKDIDFRYRFSGMDGKIILGSRIKLERDKKVNIKNKMHSFNKKRGWIKKIQFPSAGSVFKNPDNKKPAGMLIESCGLKGKRIGRAEISDAHANIIVNLGRATAKDVLGLIDLARDRVREKFGIELQLELRII